MPYNLCMTKRTKEHNKKIGESLRARGVGSSPTKVCPRCEQELPRSAFKVRKNGHTYSYCEPCHREYAAERQRRYKASTPHLEEKRRENNRRTKLRLSYGISPEEYDALLAKQGGVCAICGQPPKRGRAFLDVDHCHSSNAIRGLLCSDCNLCVGLMDDDPERLVAAADYLRAASDHSSKLVK